MVFNTNSDGLFCVTIDNFSNHLFLFLEVILVFKFHPRILIVGMQAVTALILADNRFIFVGITVLNKNKLNSKYQSFTHWRTHWNLIELQK